MYKNVRLRTQEVRFADGQLKFDWVKSVLSVTDVQKKDIPGRYVAYVVPVKTDPKNLLNDEAGSIEEITTTFGILIGIKSINDRNGEKGNEILEDLLKCLQTSFIGFSPDDGYRACTLGTGQLISLASNGIWWMQHFKTTHSLESTYEQY